MKLKHLFVFLILFGSASICVAQSPIASNHQTASSQINVRIPVYAIITLADNSSKVTASKTHTDPRSLRLSEQVATAGVISNKKWSVNMFKENETVNLTASNNSPKSSVSNKTAGSVTIVYVTSLN